MWWIEIETSAGAKVGTGPITSATRWDDTPKLSKIGSFSFVLPAEDPLAAYITYNRVVRCYKILNGAVVEVASGIVQQLNHNINAKGEVELVVKGSDLLQEWADVIVHRDYYDMTSQLPLQVHTLAGETLTELTWLKQGGTAVPDPIPEISVTADHGNFIYILFYSPPTGLQWEIASFPAVNIAEPRVQYFDGRGWFDYSGLVNTTIVEDEGSFRQNGEMTWPSVNAERQIFHNDVYGYWIRMSSLNGVSAFRVQSLRVEDRHPLYYFIEDTNNEYLESWTLAVSSSTPPHWLGSAWGQSALEVIRMACDFGRTISGQRTQFVFRAEPGRVARFINPVDEASSPVVLTIVSTPTGGQEDTATLLDLKLAGDSVQQATTIFPIGAGEGDEKVTLAIAYELDQLSDPIAALPTGYVWETRSATLHGIPQTIYGIKNDTLATALGRPIERAVAFKNTAPMLGGKNNLHASIALLNKSVTWLKTRETVPTRYNVTVTDVNSADLKLGVKVRLLYNGFDADGVRWLTVDGVFFVTSLSHSLLANGPETYKLGLSSDLIVEPEDNDLIVELAADVRALQRTPQPIGGEALATLPGAPDALF